MDRLFRAGGFGTCESRQAELAGGNANGCRAKETAPVLAGFIGHVLVSPYRVEFADFAPPIAAI
jgi:hypothetical protein